MLKDFKFNERAEIEEMIKSGFVDKSNISSTIYKLAKYNYHILGLSDDESYLSIMLYITSNCKHVIEEMIYNDINKCISSAKKHKFADVKEVCITQNEIDIIRGTQDIKKEKILFVMLAAAKYINALSGQNYDSIFLDMSDIFKMARVTIKSDLRDVFMQFAYDDGFLIRHNLVDSTMKKLSFVSHDENDKIVMTLGESDYKDLAYTYMAYLEPYNFRRCHTCRKWIRRNKNGSTICHDCKKLSVPKPKMKVKVVECEECGSIFPVDTTNMNKTRCDECQFERDKSLKSQRNARYYESHK